MSVGAVTPYDTTHLGHARTFLVFDVLARLLESGGVAVRYAQNVTDVDESILQRAARDGGDWRALGRREERAFLDDMDRLGWRTPDVMPPATRESPRMRRLIDPHHENELAQSETATGTRPFVTFWLHAGPVRLGGRKMSKSDGNMVFVRDALARGTPQALRLYLLDRHYRRPFDHVEDRLAKARTRAAALADHLAGAPVGPVAGDAATRAALPA